MSNAGSLTWEFFHGKVSTLAQPPLLRAAEMCAHKLTFSLPWRKIKFNLTNICGVPIMCKMRGRK